MNLAWLVIYQSCCCSVFMISVQFNIERLNNVGCYMFNILIFLCLLYLVKRVFFGYWWKV